MSTSQPYEEKELLLRIAAGDERAFTVLFKRYQDSVYAYTWKVTRSQTQAEDILQEVFFTIWRDRENLVNVHHVRAYIFGMMKHRLLDNFRKLHAESLLMKYLEGRPVKATHLEHALNYAALTRRVTEIVKQLPPQQKMVFQLSREQGLKQEEIARQMGIALTTVKKHLTLALQLIRKRLREEGLLLFWLLLCSF